jgi:hypothetical protein
MNRLKNLIAISAFALVILALPSIASAQYGRNDDYGNGRYDNGRYGNIRGTIQSLKNKARSLERRSDRIDDRRNDRYNDRYGRYGNNSGRIEELTDRFRNATNDLADAYGRGRNLNNSADEARRVLDLGSQIDQELSRTRGSRNLQGQWSSIRNDLRVIAQVYNMNYNNRGSWRNRMPFPLPF